MAAAPATMPTPNSYPKLMPLTKLLLNVILFPNEILWMAVVAMLLNAEPNVVAGTRAVSHVRQMAWTAA